MHRLQPVRLRGIRLPPWQVVGSTAVGLSAKRSVLRRVRQVAKPELLHATLSAPCHVIRCMLCCVLRRVRQEVTTHLEYNETLFVTDGLAGADSKVRQGPPALRLCLRLLARVASRVNTATQRFRARTSSVPCALHRQCM